MGLEAFEIALGIVLAGLIGAFFVTYVLQRASLERQALAAKALIAELATLESTLLNDPSPTAFAQRRELAQKLESLERRVTACSKRLIGWRQSSEIERWIVGAQIDPLVADYERAGAMTTRLMAMLSRQEAANQVG